MRLRIPTTDPELGWALAAAVLLGSALGVLIAAIRGA